MSAREVHPVADLFPMLADDELAELAEDIKQRGLLQPIVLDPNGRVLDGRNRLAACELAGVEPTFETYAGDDPDGYALAVNIARRHLTTGARAILVAQAARLNGKSTRQAAGETDLVQSRINEANQVLDWCDATVIKDVLAGTKPLSKAVEEARQLKREDADREAKKARLRDAAPDLLARVGEGMDLSEALGALEVRERRAQQEAEEARREAEARASEEERLRREEERERLERLERHRERIRMVTSGWPTMREVILSDPDSDLATEVIGGLGEPDKEALRRIINEIGKVCADA